MGYFLLPLTLAFDALGGYASYYYGASFLPWLLPHFLWPVFLWLISRPVWFLVHLSLPPWPDVPWPYFQHPVWPMVGQVWIGLFLLIHLWYAVRHLIWRYNTTDWAIPQSGNPGEMKWELIRRRYQEYSQALTRFYRDSLMHVPRTFRYRDNEGRDPLVEWRGRLLLIEEAALHPRATRDLSPEMAYQLAIYNSHDWLFLDILDYYPRKFHKWHVILGIGIWLPTMLKLCAWPILHWRKRVMVNDKFAWMLGQGQAHYDRLKAQPRTKRGFLSPLPLLQQRLGQLEALIRTEYQWMKEHKLIPEDAEPPILHGPQQVPPQLQAGQPLVVHPKVRKKTSVE